MVRIRFFFGVALVTLISLLVLPVSLLQASPLVQSDDLCRLGILPAGAVQQGKSSTQCSGVIDGFKIDIGYHTFIDSAKADLQHWRDFWVNNSSLKPISLGDEGISVTQQGYIWSVDWRYGCYVINGRWPETKSPVYNAQGTPDLSEYQRNATRLLALNHEIETNLKRLPPCRNISLPSISPTVLPRAAIPSAIPTLSKPLGVLLSCETNHPDPGLITCSAQATGVSADVIPSYRWTVNNSVQTVTGSLLRLTGVQPGTHVISVIARDTRNNQDSPSQSVSFTKSVSTTGSISPSPAGGFDPLGPMLALLGSGVLLGGGGLIAAKILTGGRRKDGQAGTVTG